MLRFPLIDAFGTRLDATALLTGLDEAGIPAAHLVVYDDGIVLEVAGADPAGDAVSRGVTALRGAFSPLLPCRTLVVPDLPPGPARLTDRRVRTPVLVALAEVDTPELGFDAAVDDLARRLGRTCGPTGRVLAPRLEDATHGPRFAELVTSWARVAPPGAAATAAWVELTTGVPKLAIAGAPPAGAGPHLLAWRRPGGSTGVRPAWILAACDDLRGLTWLLAALEDPPTTLPDVPVLLDGLTWAAARRPTIATPRAADDPTPIAVLASRCTSCGLCAAVCPTDVLDASGRVLPATLDACLRCYDCVEVCPEDALRPTTADDTSMRGDHPLIADGWLARLRGATGPAEPAPFPPSWLTPRKDPPMRPRVVLGLAILTQQEHAAVLVIDGRVVGAVEEEKLVRIRHYGWTPQRGPRHRNLGVDPTLAIEQVLAHRSVRWLLAEHALTLDDVDLVAVNGLPSRYRRALPVLDADAPIPVLHAGRLVAVPHHLCHAASAYRVSGFDRAWVLTVDGRGDRETAGLFRADGATLRPVRTVLSLTDRSIGGVYETVTRALGFGSHGQGSVMALASFGTPDVDLSPWLSARTWDDVSVHEGGLSEAIAHRTRAADAPLTDDHRNLAASLQAALEHTLGTLVAAGAADGPVDALCLAGGVTLNCAANEQLRRQLGEVPVFAQPGANDAGTALGAAAEAWASATGENLAPMTTASLGPAFDDDAIEQVLKRARVVYRRVEDVADDVAQRLVDGQVVCWFQDGLEFGPRALGARSILADPRNASLHARVNALKDREPWRPFGPSILAGHEADWFEHAFDSRFMLFTQTVRQERRAQVPVIVHVDGTSRPQVVHADTHPRYHALISAFHRRTGVPIVVDTSFNRRGEPIVARPEDALDAFAGLGADVLAIGSFLVERDAVLPPEPVPVLADDVALAALPGGRRLNLRVTTSCDLSCGHCTLRDHVKFGAPVPRDDVWRSLVEGRRAGCDELVLMRGEPTALPDLVGLVRRARGMGYRFVQLQTHGRAFADARRLRELRDVGVDAAEVMLLGADAPVHDALAGVDGAFRETVTGLQQAVRSGMDVLVTVPVLRRNLLHLTRMMVLLHKVGVTRVQLSFPRPIELPTTSVDTRELVRLAPAAAATNRAARYAVDKLGLSVSTEGFPLCRLDAALHGTPDATEDFGRHRVDDAGFVLDTFTDVRAAMRPDAPACKACALASRCPRTWGVYLERFGSAELRTVTT